jgi:ADP-ribosyl-[dinitrogen reductase] hydrolase
MPVTEIRTSQTHPLLVDFLDLPGGGRLGMTFCPGKHDLSMRGYRWRRDLDADLDALAATGVDALVTLMEADELPHVNVTATALRDGATARGLVWYHWPIPDMGTPGAAFDAACQSTAPGVIHRLRASGTVALHCRGGMGRTGLVAACLLVELGETPAAAIERVRRARPGTIETEAQARYVHAYRPRFPAG